MSASRDKSQKISFVFSNFYHLYKKGKDAANAAPSPADLAKPMAIPAMGPQPPKFTKHAEATRAAEALAEALKSSGTVLKTGDLSAPERAQIRVKRHIAPEFIARRVALPARAGRKAPPATLPPSAAITSLRENLRSLNELHARLRFMLSELEDLVKE